MRLLTSTDLSLRVLMRLSAAPDEHVNTEVLARELAVSRHHLHKIVQYLTEVGLVRTIRGARGGAMLALPANEIRVGEFIRGHERDQAMVECFRPDGGACNLLPRCRLRGMLASAKDAFYQYLDRYTLADCLAGPSPLARERPKPKRSRARVAKASQRRSNRSNPSKR